MSSQKNIVNNVRIAWKRVATLLNSWQCKELRIQKHIVP